MDAKSEAIRCWTSDPCGSVEGEPGTADYAEQLIAARQAYAPWMADALGYGGTADLSVLDVGCGQGIDLIRYARAGARVVGIDLTPRHVTLARAHLEALDLHGEVIEGDAETLPFPDDSFDRVSSNGVLHHTPDMGKALREIRRVLRPTGEARLIVYNRDSFYYWLTQVGGYGVARARLVRGHGMSGVLSRHVERTSIGARPLVRVFSRRQFARVIARAGFGAVSVVPRHFRLTDTPLTFPIARLVGPCHIDLLGRIGGWYLVARAS